MSRNARRALYCAEAWRLRIWKARCSSKTAALCPLIQYTGHRRYVRLQGSFRRPLALARIATAVLHTFDAEVGTPIDFSITDHHRATFFLPPHHFVTSTIPFTTTHGKAARCHYILAVQPLDNYSHASRDPAARPRPSSTKDAPPRPPCAPSSASRATVMPCAESSPTARFSGREVSSYDGSTILC